jgi:hypothetical protein
MKLIDLKERIILKDIEKASSTFKNNISRLIDRSNEIELFDEIIEYGYDDVFISFGKQPLPRERNTVVVGNKFYDKRTQFQKLKNKVNTINTYTDQLEVLSKKFIAKKNIGHKQQGQLINQLPDNPDEYVFQGLVDILAEFRVVVYFMNNEYHVSGIYKKTGSNVSLSQISQDSKIGSMVSDMAIDATEILGYGLSGADIAVVNASNLGDLVLAESFIGAISSKATKIIGKINNIDHLMDDNYLVLLEANSYPSVGAPHILYDLLKSLDKNKV